MFDFMGMLTDFVNLLIEGLVNSVNALSGIFPDSPFKAPIAAIRSSMGSEMLGYINYFLPVSEMISILTGWVVSIFMYYAISVIMRWVRAIS